MKILSKYTKLIFLIGLALMFVKCSDDDDTIPQTSAAFTQLIDNETGTVAFINISENANTYAWDFGDGEISTEINPIKTYPAGSYTVTLTATNSAGQSDTFSDNITITTKIAPSLPITFDEATVDFEPTTFGGASFAVVDNLDVSGVNATESKVGAITNIGATFEGFFFNLNTAIDLTSQKAIAMSFWSTIQTTVLLKLEEGSSAPIETAISHGGTGWETLTFNFNSSAQYARFTLFVDGPGTTAGTFYLDNIIQTDAEMDTGGNEGDPIPPMQAAPTPTQAATDVISVYSDAYEDVPKEGFNFYGAAAFEEAIIDGNNALKYTFVEGDGGNFQVIELGGANQIDAAAQGMTNFRFDIWFPNAVDENTAFLMKLVNFDPNGTSEANINVNASSNPAISQGSWLQFDVPFTELQNNGLTASSNIQQVVIDLLTSGEVFIDNIYFYKPPSDTGGNGNDSGGTSIVALTFSDTTSIEPWERIADANSPEASIDWVSDGGVEGGAMKIQAANPSDAAGKAYIFQLTTNELNYDGATDVTLTFDLKLVTPLTAAAVHLQTNIPGVGVVNNFDLQNNGLNLDSFTSYSFDFAGVASDANTFTIHFNFASGAVENAGGELLIDNIKLVKK